MLAPVQVLRARLGGCLAALELGKTGSMISAGLAVLVLVPYEYSPFAYSPKECRRIGSRCSDAHPIHRLSGH